MRYKNADSYFRDLFGEKVYKISLDGGMNCPNRDKDKKGGCVFCSDGGSGDFASPYIDDVKTQIDKAIEFLKDKKTNKFIAYFQSFTNTYAPIEYLRKLFLAAIEDDRVCALSIATRPDCISSECLDLLSELNKRKKVFIELGLQTSNDITAKIINRGYMSDVYTKTSSLLRERGINVITHLIIGLPGESENDLISSVKFINDKTDGVKFHLLHILKNTRLNEMYEKGKYMPLERLEYIRLLSLGIMYLKKDIVVHRITGDAPKKLLVEPKWSADKKRVLNDINKYFNEHDIYQGKLMDQD